MIYIKIERHGEQRGGYFRVLEQNIHKRICARCTSNPKCNLSLFYDCNFPNNICIVAD